MYHLMYKVATRSQNNKPQSTCFFSILQFTLQKYKDFRQHQILICGTLQGNNIFWVILPLTSCQIPKMIWSSLLVQLLLKAQQLIESRNPALTLQQIETAFKFPLDAFQRESVQHYLQGHSVLVCAPTGAGKTAIAEAATIAALAR